MVVNDAPAVASLLEYQSESPVRFVIGAFEAPLADHDCRVFAEHVHLEIGKGEFSHLLGCVVILFVAFQDRLPTSSYIVAGHEDGVVRSIVSIHESFDVAFIPRIALSVEHRANGG